MWVDKLLIAVTILGASLRPRFACPVLPSVISSSCFCSYYGCCWSWWVGFWGWYKACFMFLAFGHLFDQIYQIVVRVLFIFFPAKHQDSSHDHVFLFMNVCATYIISPNLQTHCSHACSCSILLASKLQSFESAQDPT